MLFKIGIEKAEDNDTAYGIVIPALCNDKYSAYSASDEFDDIVKNAKDAVFTVMEEMALNGELDLSQIALSNKQDYSNNPDYEDFTEWAFIDIEVDEVLGKQKRINVSMSDLLIAHIDQIVKSGGKYKDRSDFLTQAALHQITGATI